MAGKALEECSDEPQDQGARFTAANGSELKYYSNKNVKFVTEDKVGKGGNWTTGGVCEMKFHVADATRPLASAMAVVNMGNRIVLSRATSRTRPPARRCC